MFRIFGFGMITKCGIRQGRTDFSKI